MLDNHLKVTVQLVFSEHAVQNKDQFYKQVIDFIASRNNQCNNRFSCIFCTCVFNYQLTFTPAQVNYGPLIYVNSMINSLFQVVESSIFQVDD